LDAGGDLPGQFLVEPAQQQLLGVLTAQVADLVELLRLLADERIDLLQTLVELFAALVQLPLNGLEGAFLLDLGLVLLLERVLALVQAALLFAQLPAELLGLAVEGLALLEEFVLRLEFGFLADV